MSHSSNVDLKTLILQERLKQARWSYYLAFVATAASFSITFTGAIALLLNRVPEGVTTSASGLVGTARCAKLCKDANDRLDKLLNEQKKL